MSVYKLFWDEYSSWFLEIVKPAYQQPIDSETYKQTLAFFEKLLLLLHPFMPFISEELWQNIAERKSGETIMLELQPKVGAYREETVSTFENTKQVVSAIRTIRLEKNIPSRDKLELYVIGVHASELNPIVEKMAGLSAIQTLDEKPAGSVSFMVGTTEFAIPLVGFINVDEEISKIQSEIEYLNGFLEKVNQKLGNERFVNNAKPEGVESERKKKLDAEMKIRTLEENLANFKSKNQ